MPEGDTILRTAITLSKAVVGQPIKEASSNMLGGAMRRLVGDRITKIEARGKNLLMHFESGLVLYSHMKMTGSWHVYRPGERWRKKAQWARCRLATDAYEIVCFTPPVLELLTPSEVERHPVLSTLGPDVLSSSFKPGDAVARLRGLGNCPIGEAVLDQRALCGIGNIYKSETLFICQVNPWAKTSELSDQKLTEIVMKASELMRQNVPGMSRRTAPSAERTWVYRRRRRPCYRCATPIASERQGATGRTTYYCPRCQGVHSPQNALSNRSR